MAIQNVIDYPLFSKESAVTLEGASFEYEKNLREPDAHYSSKDLAEKIAQLLNRPLWPLFPEGVYLNSRQARQLYRTAQGISGIVHILNRAEYTADSCEDQLNEPQRSRLWNALIELSADVMRLTDDMLQHSMNDTGR